MLRTVVRFVWVCASVWVALNSQPARACSGFNCWPDQYAPRAGTVPANLPAIAWWFGRSYGGFDDADAGGPFPVMTTADDLVFECGSDAAGRRTIPVDVAMSDSYAQIIPKTALVAGESCTVHSRVVRCDLSKTGEGAPWHPHDQSYLTGRATFSVGASSPLPAALGTFEVEPAKLEPIELSEGAGCSGTETVCAVRGEIALSDEARPWKDAFVYETRVDGKPWRLFRAAPLPREEGSSYVGRGREILFAKRPGVTSYVDVSGLSAGRHTVVIRASLAGTQTRLETEPVEIDLNCFADKDSGVQAPGDAGQVSEGDASEVEPEMDADTPDAGKSWPKRRASDARIDTSSCNLISPGAPQGSLPAFVLLTLFGLVMRRRGQPRRGTPATRA